MFMSKHEAAYTRRAVQGSTDQVHRRPGVRSLSEIGAGLHVSASSCSAQHLQADRDAGTTTLPRGKGVRVQLSTARDFRADRVHSKGLGHVDSARRDGEITEWRSTTKSTASGALRQPRRVDHWAELNRLNGLGRHHNNNWRGSIHKHFHVSLFPF